MSLPTSFPFLDHDGVLAFAHRGGAGDWPENTMPGFEASVGLGYPYVETDVHVTADGELLAFHDDHLDRVTDRSGAIVDLPWREVSQARVDGREPIPRLEDILGSWPHLRVNIDPKHDACVDSLVAVITRTNALDRVCCGSFSDRRLTALRRRLGSRLCTSLGPRPTARLWAASLGARIRPLPGPCVQVPHRLHGVPVVNHRFVRAAHARGLQVHVWTIDDPAEMDELCDLGVDGIMTDRPAVLKEVLERRGQWTAGSGGP